MLAAVMTAPNTPLSVEEVTPVEARPNDVLVEVTACGICHSDLLFLEGGGNAPPPTILGHEGAGIVEEIGRDVHSVAVGDRVIFGWVQACGRCWSCANGEAHLCVGLYSEYSDPKMQRGDGSIASRMLGIGVFAEQALVDERALIKVETDLPSEQLALIACGVMTGVGAALNTARVRAGSTVAVVGCGGVGQSVVQGARIAGAARIVAIDPVELKRATALQLGATDTIDPTQVDALEEVRSLTGGRGADFVFEVAGLEHTLRQAFELTRRGGTLVMVAVHPPTATQALPWSAFDTVIQEKRVLGCFYGSAQLPRDVPRLIGLVEADRLDIASMVSRRLRLDEVNDGFEAMQQGEVIRSVIVNEKG
jgi:S-(hydroxymethyl)glutathione dehydrogenase / alcohol dehydrogenase